MQPRICPACHCQFKPKRVEQKFCCQPCAISMRPAPERKLIGKWGTSLSGYIVRKEWIGDKRVTVKQHRLVAEEKLGRPLLLEEDVHHINGDKTDNRPENLVVLNHGDHTIVTNSERTYKRGYSITITGEESVRRRERIVSAGKALRGTKKSEETKERMKVAQKRRREEERNGL